MGTQQYDHNVTIAMKYMHALNTMKLDALLAMLSGDCVVRDPYTIGQIVGEEGLRGHYEAFINIWQYFEMRADSIYPGGTNRLAVRWSVSATAQNRRTAEYSGISVFQFQNDKITQIESYWNHETLQKQIQ